MSRNNDHLHHFGNCVLDSEKKVLWSQDVPVPLPLKAVELLSLLVERRGEVVTKDEIWSSVWQDSFVEETNLTHNIYLLRRTLKNLGEPDPIQTVPRRGYRFSANLSLTAHSNVVIEKHSITQTVVEELPSNGRLKRASAGSASTLRWIGGAALVLMVLGVVFGVWSLRQNTSATSIPRLRSVLVLPLVPLAPNDEDTALGFGIADALITRLGKVNEIRIVSTSTASRYAVSNNEPIDIGRELGVDGVLEGTLQRANGKLRVTLRLLRTSDGAQIWSGMISDAETEIFRLQDSVAFQTAQALNLNVTLDGAVKRPTGNLEAYSQFLKGDFLFRRRGEMNVSASVPFFKEAVRLDPNFARAWAGWAAVHAMGTDIPQAERLLKKAIELDPELAEAHATHGFIQMFHYWNWMGAENSLNRAIELDPNSLQARHWRGVYLSFHGRFDEARAEMERALELDPVSINITADLGQLYYFMEDFDRAEEYCNRALAIDPEYGLAHGYLRRIHEAKGEYEKAYRHLVAGECWVRDIHSRKACIDYYENAYGRGGWPKVSELFVGRLRETSAGEQMVGHRSSSYYALALFSARSGDLDAALDYLERSVDVKSRFESMNFGFPYLKIEPQLKPLRDDPRFQAILRKVNL